MFVDPPVLLCLLGEPRVLVRGKPTPALGPKANLLLAILGLRQQHCAPREVLLDQIWPGLDAELAGQNLNALTSSLRRSLGAHLGNQSPVLWADGCYRLNNEAGICVDVAQFELAFELGERAAQQCNWPEAVPALSRAIALYRGDLQIGDSAEFLIYREHLRSRYLQAHCLLAGRAAATGDWAQAREHAFAILKHDLCDELAHRLLMHAFAALGQRVQALRQYQLLERVLRTHLDCAPDACTVRVRDAIRAGAALPNLSLTSA